MDKSNNGNPKVSRTLKKLTAKLRKAIKKNRMTVRFMFKAMDTDGNGLLSAEELRVGLQPYVPNAELDVGVMEEIIGYVDKDGDNEVTFEEDFGTISDYVFIIGAKKDIPLEVNE